MQFLSYSSDSAKQHIPTSGLKMLIPGSPIIYFRERALVPEIQEVLSGKSPNPGIHGIPQIKVCVCVKKPHLLNHFGMGASVLPLVYIRLM